MIREMLNAIKEWTEEKFETFKMENRKVIIPEDYGAVGDGVTIDDNAFPEGNYIYQLSKGKTYSVTLDKLRAICNNTCTGEGVIRCYRTNYYHTHAYQNNVDILPIYGNDAGKNIVELSYRSKKNRLLECINHISNEHSFNTEGMGRYYRTQGVSVKEDVAHTYHGIGAVQHEYDKELPDTFTICLGRQKILTRKKGGSTWIKTIDELPSPLTGARNYGLPWGGQTGEAARAFTIPPTIVDDHLEVTVKKEEFLSWLGTGGATEGNLHFWTHNYEAAANEFYDAIICQEAWVKEKEASNKLMYTLGIDCFRDYDSTTKKYGYFSQIIYDVQHHLTNSPQVFYGCTMDVDGALEVDFDEISALMAEDTLTKRSTIANYNILGFTGDFEISQGAYTLSYNKENDVFTFDINPDVPTNWQTLDLTPYLVQIPDIKADEEYRCYIQLLDGKYVSQATFYYKSGKPIAMASGYTSQDNIYTKAFVAETDFEGLMLGTSAKVVQYPHFRIWITKGTSYKGYQPYGKEIYTKFMPSDVVNEITEEKIKYLEDWVNYFSNSSSAAVTKLTQLEARIDALENN